LVENPQLPQDARSKEYKMNFEVRDGFIVPVNHEDRDSAVFANKSGLLVTIKIRHRISGSVKHTTDEMIKKLEDETSRSLRHTSRA
jgi:DNA recombination-dependent growth factor C